MARSSGSPRTVSLEDRKDSEPRERILRVVYGKDISVKWTFSLDAAGRILDLDYEWE